MTSPLISGDDSTAMIVRGAPLGLPGRLLKASDPAILNAISDESTSWYEPYVRMAVLDDGYRPGRRTPRLLDPGVDGRMYSRG